MTLDDAPEIVPMRRTAGPLHQIVRDIVERLRVLVGMLLTGSSSLTDEPVGHIYLLKRSPL